MIPIPVPIIVTLVIAVASGAASALGGIITRRLWKKVTKTEAMNRDLKSRVVELEKKQTDQVFKT